MAIITLSLSSLCDLSLDQLERNASRRAPKGTNVSEPCAICQRPLNVESPSCWAIATLDMDEAVPVALVDEREFCAEFDQYCEIARIGPACAKKYLSKDERDAFLFGHRKA
tara:strand:- start:10055 stop:10387 length:333 start_codon:yes stop_codon:yes gene_type:complete